MRYGIGIITLLALVLVGTPAGAQERIEVRVGEERLLEVAELTRLALGNVEYAEVRTEGDSRVRVTGVAPGSTTLLVWSRSGARREYTVVVTGEAAPGKPPPPDETLTLTTGGTHELRVKGLVRLAVGDPEVADVEAIGGGGVRITASKAGETLLLVWSGDKKPRAYRIVVQG